MEILITRESRVIYTTRLLTKRWARTRMCVEILIIRESRVLYTPRLPTKRWAWTRMCVEILITRESRVIYTPRLPTKRWTRRTRTSIEILITRVQKAIYTLRLPTKRWTRTRMCVEILITKKSRVIYTQRLPTTRNCHVVASILMKAFTQILPTLCSDAEAALATFHRWADGVLLINHSIGRCSVDRAGAKVVDLHQHLRPLKLLTHAKLTLSKLKMAKPCFQVVTKHANISSLCVLVKAILVSFGHLIVLLSTAPMPGVLRLTVLVL